MIEEFIGNPSLSINLDGEKIMTGYLLDFGSNFMDAYLNSANINNME